MAAPTRRELLSALAERDLLPLKTDLDYYLLDGDVYTQAVNLLRANGWLDGVTATRSDLSSGTFETFEIAGVEFSSPRGVTPLTDRRRMPIEKLDGPVTIIVDGQRAEIDGPLAEGLRAAVYTTLSRQAWGPLASPDEPHDSNVIPLGRHGRGRLVASDAFDREGA